MTNPSAQVELLGRYVLTHRLARGGMAEVWLAREEGVAGFERIVCVKKILPDLSENAEFRDMFIEEARIAARLNHANIIQVYDLGVEADVYYIAMQFVLGEHLGTLAKLAKVAGKKIPFEIAAYVIAEAARGLFHAHERRGPDGSALNIVHRDISPQNVMVSYEGEVKVLDFGIAKAKDRLVSTQEGIVKGKARYMSPEQLRAQPLDHRTDQFALGATLWELVTGRKMIEGTSEGAIMAQLLHYAPQRPSTVESSVPAALDDVIFKTIAEHPEQRYANCREMQLALERYLRTTDQPMHEGELADFMLSIGATRMAAKDKLVHESSQMQADAVPEERRTRKRTKSLLSNPVPDADTTTPGSPRAMAGGDPFGELDTLEQEPTPARSETDLGEGDPGEGDVGDTDAVEPPSAHDGAVAVVESRPPDKPARSTWMALAGGAMVVVALALVIGLQARTTGDDVQVEALASTLDVGVAAAPEGAPERAVIDIPVKAAVDALDAGAQLGQPDSAAADTDAAPIDADAAAPAPTTTRATPTRSKPTRTRTKRVARSGPGRVNVVAKFPVGDSGRAELFVAGRRVGSPPTVLKLAAGSHVIELRPRGRPTMRRTVQVSAGETSKLVFDVRAQIAQTGLIKITARRPGGAPLPGAAIRIDGVMHRERTPATVRLLSGSHTVEVRMPDGSWKKRTVKTTAGRLQKLQF